MAMINFESLVKDGVPVNEKSGAIGEPNCT